MIKQLAELAIFLMEDDLDLKNDWQITVVQTVWQPFSLKGTSESITSGKQLTVCIANDKNFSFQVTEFCKTFINHYELDSFPTVNLCGKIGGDVNKCDFFLI